MKLPNLRISVLVGLIAASYSLTGCGLLDSKDDESSGESGDAAADDTTSTECTTGGEGCACYGNGTCDTGLACLSKLCVDRGDDNEGDAGSSKPNDEDDGEKDEADTDDTESNDDTSSQDDTSSEDPSTSAPTDDGNSEPNEPTDDVTSDEGPDSVPDASVEDPDPTSDPTEDPTTEDPTSDPTEDPTTEDPTSDPTEDPTTEDPTTEDPTSDTTEDPTTEEPTTEDPTTEDPTTEDPTTEDPTTEDPTSDTTDVPPACEPSGSCVNDDGVDCVNGEPVERDCSSCALVLGCENCCEGVGYFAAQTQPDYESMPELIGSYTAGDSSASLAVTFTDQDQLGAIAFNFDSAVTIEPDLIVVQATATGDVSEVTISLEDNSSGTDSGCLYQMEFDPDYDEYYWPLLVDCWGDFVGIGDGDTVDARSINVRVGSADGGAASLTVYGVTW